MYRSVTCCYFLSLTQSAMYWHNFPLSFALVAEHPDYEVMGGSITCSVYVKRLFDALGEWELTRRALEPPATTVRAWGLSPVSFKPPLFRPAIASHPARVWSFFLDMVWICQMVPQQLSLRDWTDFTAVESSRICQVRERKDSKLLNLSYQIWGQVQQSASTPYLSERH